MKQQGPTVFVAGAGGHGLKIFSLGYHIFSLPLSLSCLGLMCRKHLRLSAYKLEDIFN